MGRDEEHALARLYTARSIFTENENGKTRPASQVATHLLGVRNGSGAPLGLGRVLGTLRSPTLSLDFYPCRQAVGLAP